MATQEGRDTLSSGVRAFAETEMFEGTEPGAEVNASANIMLTLKELFDNNFMRFATNMFQEMLGLEEVPIRLMLRARNSPKKFAEFAAPVHLSPTRLPGVGVIR